MHYLLKDRVVRNTCIWFMGWLAWNFYMVYSGYLERAMVRNGIFELYFTITMNIVLLVITAKVIHLRYQVYHVGIPNTIKEYWYTGQWYTKRCGVEDLPLQYNVLFDPWECGLVNVKRTSHLIDGLIPAVRNSYGVGLYNVTKRYRGSGGSDLAGWDDGMEVDLKLVRIIPVAKDWNLAKHVEATNVVTA